MSNIVVSSIKFKYSSTVVSVLDNISTNFHSSGPEGDVMLLINLDSTKVMKCELLHKLMARRMVKMVRFLFQFPTKYKRR